MITLRNTAITFLFMIALGLSTWSILLSKQSQPRNKHIANNIPDAMMENVIATVMNKSGTPALKIESPRMVHYVENDTTQITAPRVTVYRQSPNPWFITSKHAKAINGTKQIVFQENVVIHHPSDVADPTTTMETAELTIYPETEIAQTHDSITITQPDTIVHAVGMLANLNTGTVKLLSQAKGEYVPNA